MRPLRPTADYPACARCGHRSIHLSRIGCIYHGCTTYEEPDPVPAGATPVGWRTP